MNVDLNSLKDLKVKVLTEEEILSFPYNPLVEDIVNVLMDKTQNYDPNFFRLQTNFFLALVPSNLHISVQTHLGAVPVNLYGINLSQSGSGKGISTHFLENDVLGGYRSTLTYNVLPKKAKLSLDNAAINKSAAWQVTHQEALDKLEAEYKSYGAPKFSVDDATVPALKQYRNKIILGGAGAITLIVDEIGANLIKLEDVLAPMMELYDRGNVKDKLTKNTKDSERYEELFGSTPTNMMMFGTPSKLLDGGRIEEKFFVHLHQGYARRCFIAYGTHKANMRGMTPERLYALLMNQKQNTQIAKLHRQLESLAEVALVGKTISLPEESLMFWLSYYIFCMNKADELPEHQDILKTELGGSHFKALKLAAVYAFIDGRLSVSIDDLKHAMRFAQDTFKSLTDLMHREKPYARLAKYIASSDSPLTQVDLMEQLPYYPQSASQRQEMMKLAIAWGYSKNIVLKTSIIDGVEFFSGESLKETDLSKLRLSTSEDAAYGYEPAEVSFEEIADFVVQPNFHWTTHFFNNGHRCKEEVIAGFNLLVLDVDDGTQINVIRKLLEDYTYIIHTTKRHLLEIDEDGDPIPRCRVILPMNYTLELDEKEYKKFMENVRLWCPFNLDRSTFDICRKWATHNGELFVNKGELLDVLPLIPKTYREDEYVKKQQGLASIDALHRWFINEADKVGRNNVLIKYALMLLDNGWSKDAAKEAVITLNSEFPNPLEETEILHSIFVTIDRK